MTLVPPESPVTNPVVLTYATAGVPETQGFVVAAVPEPVSWVVPPTQMDVLPLIVGGVQAGRSTTNIPPFRSAEDKTAAPLPVAPIVGLIAQAAPTVELPALWLSKSSVKAPGEVVDQLALFQVGPVDAA